VEHLHDESEDLKLHTHLCAERYKGIQEQFEVLEQRLDRVEKKVDNIHEDIRNGNASMTKVLVGTAGTVIAGLLSTIVVILLQ
jgi:uncharacterized protein Yka (UPF0111/DUF47 family)